MAYELIETVEVGAGGASSIEFTSIPQDGLDLVLKVSGRVDDLAIRGNGKFSINNDTSTSYSRVYLRGSNGAVQISAATNSSARDLENNGDASTANTFGSVEIYFANYTSTTDKSYSMDLVNENNDSNGGFQKIQAGLYPTSSPITSLELLPQAGVDFMQYSTASLYKIS